MSTRQRLFLLNILFLALCFGRAAAQSPVTEFVVQIQAKNAQGELVPATLTITSESTGLSQKGTLRNGSYTVSLKAGATYEIEANHEEYRTVRKKLVLGVVRDPALARETVELAMLPRQPRQETAQTAVTVRIIDGTSGRPLNEGFDIRVEDLTRGQTIQLITASKNTVTFRTQPLHRFRFVVKANGFQPYRYESEARMRNDIIIPLRREAGRTPKTYTLRLVDEASQARIRTADIQLISQYDQAVELKQDRDPGEWLAALDDSTSYRLTVRATGYEPLALPLPRPAGPLILLPMRKAAETPVPAKPEEQVVTARPIAPAPATLPELTARTRATTLDNVFFDQSSYQLRPESHAQLDLLADQLKNRPTLRIEIAGHTDNVGDPRLNQALSENRARVISNYLTGKGIEAGRIRFRGYGSQQPVAPNDSEENKRKNRRVEVRVLSE